MHFKPSKELLQKSLKKILRIRGQVYDIKERGR